MHMFITKRLTCICANQLCKIFYCHALGQNCGKRRPCASRKQSSEISRNTAEEDDDGERDWLLRCGADNAEDDYDEDDCALVLWRISGR